MNTTLGTEVITQLMTDNAKMCVL